ncbi:RNA polymerase sigma factor [Raoultella sp. WB_B2P2-3]|uniref:RNA polymerase sigma factor n=1 Tax=Raoultella scottii TaxID=3040937 RepID=A0ABU8Z7A5_9ENTR
MSNIELQVLFERHAQPLLAYLKSQLHDAQLADDLMQESFARLSEHYPQGKIQDSESYLFRTARNLLFDHYRQQQRRQTMAFSDDEMAHFPSDDPGAEQRAIDQQQVERIIGQLLNLPERTQAIFRLSRLEGLPQAEIATRLGVSLSTVEKHLAQALATLMCGIQK